MINDIKDFNTTDIQDHPILKISKKENRVELPYTKDDIEKLLTTYPKYYKSVQDVIRKEYIYHITMYYKHPMLARFRESYYLCRTKEMKSILASFIFAKNMMFRKEIEPAIIAAVKSQKQLEEYIECLKQHDTEHFPYFQIVFEGNNF